MKNILFLLLILFCSSLYVKAQDIGISFSFASSIPDKRHDFLVIPTHIEIFTQNKISLDDEFTLIGFIRGIDVINIFEVDLGIGYSVLFNDARLPIKSGKYFKSPIYILYFSDLNVNYNAFFYGKISKSFSNKKNIKDMRLGLSASPNWSFLKEIRFRGEQPTFSRKKWNKHSLEIYTELDYKYKSIFAGVGVRVFYFKYKDEALANNGKNIDSYNPFKIKFTIGYIF